MDKLANQLRKSKLKVSSSLDFLNVRGLFEEHTEENHLKWMTFSSNPVSLLPVFLGSADLTETETLERAGSIEVLTPRELNRSMETAMLPQSFQLLSVHVKPSQQANPFKATLLWEKIVFHLERSIKCGRHTQGLKIYDNCFQGAKAVVCLSSYLNTILPKTVTREQVLTLCHKLVNTGVMEDVRGKEKTIFKEGHLYRFSGEHFWETPTTGKASSSTPDPSIEVSSL